MSKSYRDKERIQSKKAHKEIIESINSLTPDDIAQKYSNSKGIKEVVRYGNKRKSVAKDKVQERRAERRKGNDFDSNY